MKVLIVVDVQNDFITGALGSKEAVAVIPNIKKKIEEYHAAGYDIIFTRDTHGVDYLETNEGKNLPVVHCIKGTEGWQIVDGLETPDCQYIDKPTFGWLGWPKDFPYDEIELIGVCTDICVVSNALILKAMYPEAKITVDASCCAGVTPELHDAALATMRSCQICVQN